MVPMLFSVAARTAVPLLLLSAVVSLRLGWPGNIQGIGLAPGESVIEQGRLLLTTLCWIAFGFLVNRLCYLLLWRGLLPRAGIVMPSMLVTLLEVVLWVATLSIIVTGVYGHSVTALLATSTVLIGVAGFAVQKLIADFFAGIVLGIERPYSVGDWLQIETDGAIGKVVEFNWRSTRILTSDETTVVVPNSHLASTPFTNFSLPGKHYREQIRIRLPYRVTTHQGQRILLGAVSQIDEIASLPGKPVVTIDEYDSSGVVWEVIFPIRDPGRRNAVRFMVHQNILRNLHYAGIRIPVPMQEVHLQRGVADDSSGNDIVQLLRQSDLFANLSDEEKEALAQGAMQRLYFAPEPILRQGNPGSSLFILNEGLLGVWMADADGKEKQIARIHPGEFFGELSLLTGEPRGATVIPVTDCLITEIGKDAMSELLKARPELAVNISAVLAARQSANQLNLAAASQAGDGAEKETRARQILGRIRTFFNLSA